MRHAELHVAVDGAKVGRTLKGRNIPHPVRVKEDAKPRKPETRRQLVGVHAGAAVVIHGRIERNLLRAPILHQVHVHRLVGPEAEMGELNPKAQAVIRPQRVLLTEPDRLPVVPIQLGDR
jgi:hypothetical protein